MMFRKNLLLSLILIPFAVQAQIQYQNVKNKNLSLGSYGRVGVDWSLENNGSIGRRLNLNNMGSVGGRMEEQDYLELVPALHFTPFGETDSTEINVQMRFSAYSQSLSPMGYVSTSSPGGLTIAMPELYAEARNIGGSEWTVWLGARLYRGPDVHIVDHFYFNDHSGQGLGVEYKDSRFGALFVSSTDTSSSLPPYFYLNIATGTPTAALRQRVVTFIEHDVYLSQTQKLTGLLEYHYMGGGFKGNDTIPEKYNFPNDYGFVLGARLNSDFEWFKSFHNKLAVRYGSGIANGGDGGLSRTYLTFGAPNLEQLDFRKAYSLSVVEEVFAEFNDRHSISFYTIFTNSRGAGESDGLEETFYGKEVYNKKIDFALGFRESYVISKYFKLLSEFHYTQRKEGYNPWAGMTKISFAPTLSPTGDNSFWARPELRFVTSLAWYNKYAAEQMYSPYLQVVGSRRFGYYFGFKAEWWIWS